MRHTWSKIKHTWSKIKSKMSYTRACSFEAAGVSGGTGEGGADATGSGATTATARFNSFRRDALYLLASTSATEEISFRRSLLVMPE